MFCLESTEVCLKEVRCFWVSEASPPKKVLRFSPTFPTPIFEIPFIYWGFRVKDRVQDSGRVQDESYIFRIIHLVFPSFCPQYPAFSFSFRPEYSTKLLDYQEFFFRWLIRNILHQTQGGGMQTAVSLGSHAKSGKTVQEVQDNSPGREETYTLSYTGKVQVLLEFSLSGVGNVGFFQKLFLKRGVR